METLPTYTPAAASAGDTVPFVHGIAQYQLHPSATVYKVRPVTASGADTAVEFGIFDSIGRQEYVYRRSATDGSRQLCLAAGRLASEPNERQLWSIQQLSDGYRSIKLVCTKTWEVEEPSTIALTAKVDGSDRMTIMIEVPLVHVQSGLARDHSLFTPISTESGNKGIKLKLTTVNNMNHEAYARHGSLIYCRDETSNNFVSTTSFEPTIGEDYGLREADMILQTKQSWVTDPQIGFILLWNTVILDLLFSSVGPSFFNIKKDSILRNMISQIRATKKRNELAEGHVQVSPGLRAAGALGIAVSACSIM
ncbi:hypothetical protein GQ42DRAFT_49198 [Ramicandelaber brevisporus]|nr:hypothetical protein GQ42DRAFT_49198 [Ramicandelaber brevisporus]